MFALEKTEGFDLWLEGLRDPRARSKILARLLRLADGNPGDVAPVGSGVSELRIDYGPGYRVYYCQKGKALLLLLAGGDKGTQSRDIAKAIELAHDLETE